MALLWYVSGLLFGMAAGGVIGTVILLQLRASRLLETLVMVAASVTFGGALILALHRPCGS